ncbi:hypothetical protein Y032_0453g1709 [Ancylostoma ceylanicum]|uniref:Uncharacterized protein n=1 Tax=Ancylostoma ceylanicum TaxID=53326 RepID=A0A016WXZ3_9BILA|nr:hypothetical protein Y032_0453g1709 [Ancylostoma ceylanicum]
MEEYKKVGNKCMRNKVKLLRNGLANHFVLLVPQEEVLVVGVVVVVADVVSDTGAFFLIGASWLKSSSDDRSVDSYNCGLTRRRF